MIDEEDGDKSGFVRLSENSLIGFDGIEASPNYVDVVEGEDFIESSGSMTLEARISRGCQALLHVEYSWDISGTLFTCHARRYAIGNNGRSSADVVLLLTSDNASQIIELTGTAIQDGRWHNISGGGAVASDGAPVSVSFKCTCDVAFEDELAKPVEYLFIPPPMIQNPTVVWESRPVISGTGLAGAEVKLYEHNVGSVVLATTSVKENNKWSVRLEHSLLMADPFLMTATQQLSLLTSPYAPAVIFAVLFAPQIRPITYNGDELFIEGRGGLVGARLEVWCVEEVPNDPLITTVGANGYWSVSRITALPIGKHRFSARQSGPNTGEYSDWSEIVPLVISPPRLSITPPPNPAMANQALTITGVATGRPVTLRILNDFEIPVDGTFTGDGSTRIFKPAKNWANGTTHVTSIQIVGDAMSDPSAVVAIAVKPAKPVITAPPNPAMANQVLTITGVATTGTVTLQMSTDGGALVDGRFTGNGSTRSFTPTANWSVGITRINVVQTVDGVVSDPSAVVAIAVKPAKPVITAPPNPAMANQALTITGVATTGTVTLQMSTDGGALVDGRFTGNGSTRSFTPTANWSVGITRINVVQTVDGVGSDPSAVVAIAVKPAKPVITAPPNPAMANQVLTITGVATTGTVTLQMSTDGGALVDGRFTGNGSTRSFTPTANWSVGITRINVVQIVDGVGSDPSAVVAIAVKPAKPVITAPPNPAMANQVLTITGVATTGTVTLQMSTDGGALVDGRFTGNGSTRSFTPTANWSVGITRINVVQIVDGVGSDPSAVVALAVKPAKPVITAPPNPAMANQVLTITGVATGVVILQMFTTGNKTIEGEFAGSGTSRTFKPKENWKPPVTTVWVVQTVNGMDSDPSEPVAVVVTEQLPLPVITRPLPRTSHLADVRVEGTCVAGATVAVQDVFGNSLQGKVTYSETTWSFSYLWLPGAQQIKAQQSMNGQTSEATGILEFFIKPAQPDIEPPAPPITLKHLLKITGVASGAVTLQMFTGTSDTVAGVFTGSGAERLFTPAADWVPGQNTVYVIQTVNGMDSDASDPCTFTVGETDRPDAPRIQQPQAGGRTSRFPTFEIAGLPGARHTIRFDKGATLHEDIADADGILTFTVVDPLVPGTIALEVKQASGGVDSDWSAPHRFTVKAPPATPVITAPRADSETSRYPSVRGTGETGGEIVLRYAKDPQEQFACVDGSTRWSWTAKQAWSLGDYAVQARHTVDGDSSDWTEARSFKVSETRYAIGDANPAIGVPVVGTEQSVLLRVQVISGTTGEAAADVEVKWRINGTEEPLETTHTDATGWTSYRYTPETAGKHEILADATEENAGVALTELYEVNAMLEDDWSQAAELFLDGARVDLAASDLVLLKKKLPYKLELKVGDDSVLIGSTVTLQNFWGVKERGLTFFPDLGMPQMINKGSSVHWYITSEEANSGFYGLSLASPVLRGWQLPGRVEAGDLVGNVKIDLDGFPQVFGGASAFPCLGASHTLTVRPQDSSFLLGQDVVLELSAQAADLGVTVSPSSPQKLGEDGVSWTLNCVDSTNPGDFAVWLKVPALDFISAVLPMSLGHNKVKISKRFGPQQWGGSASYWRYGICATSTFTGQPAARVPVTVAVTDKPINVYLTDYEGWAYVHYYDRELASLTIRNRYDGSSG